MNDVLRVFKLFSDETRLRALMLLNEKELCVCQLMGVLGVSQPLVSRNLSLIDGLGFLDSRREGKLVFYRVKKRLSPTNTGCMRLLRKLLKDDGRFHTDLGLLQECTELQIKTGRCDMKTFLGFMEKKKRKKASRRR